MADKSDTDVKATIVEVMQNNARAGAYKKFPEFEKLCAAGEYDPEVARSCLAHHAADPVARNLLVACDRQTELWHSKLKSVEPGAAGIDGPPIFQIHVAPYACDVQYQHQWEAYLQSKGWTPPADTGSDDDEEGVA